MAKTCCCGCDLTGHPMNTADGLTLVSGSWSFASSAATDHDNAMAIIDHTYPDSIVLSVTCHAAADTQWRLILGYDAASNSYVAAELAMSGGGTVTTLTLVKVVGGVRTVLDSSVDHVSQRLAVFQGQVIPAAIPVMIERTASGWVYAAFGGVADELDNVRYYVGGHVPEPLGRQAGVGTVSTGGTESWFTAATVWRADDARACESLVCGLFSRATAKPKAWHLTVAGIADDQCSATPPLNGQHVATIHRSCHWPAIVGNLTLCGTQVFADAVWHVQTEAVVGQPIRLAVKLIADGGFVGNLELVRGTMDVVDLLDGTATYVIDLEAGPGIGADAFDFAAASATLVPVAF